MDSIGRSFPDRKHRTAYLLVATAASIGVLLQAIQNEDPRFFLWYFTVDCAIAVAVLTGTSTVMNRVVLPKLTTWLFACVLLSGLIYWSVLFPINGLGSSPPMILANLILHGVLPVLVALAQVGLRAVGPTTSILPVLSLPTIYLVAIWLVVPVTGSEVPYVFMSLSAIGPLRLLASWAIIAVASLAIAFGCRWLQQVGGHTTL